MMVLAFGGFYTLYAQFAPRYPVLVMPLEAREAQAADAQQIFPIMFSEFAFQGTIYESFDAIQALNHASAPDFTLTGADARVNPRYLVTGSMVMEGSVKVLSLNLVRATDKSLLINQQLPNTAIEDLMQNIAHFVWTFSANLPPALKRLHR
jgi:hypothetical protein